MDTDMQADGTTTTLPPLAEGITCPVCGYDLRDCTSARCSECGRDLADVRAGESLIPWERRREVGTQRAFWRTVRFALFQPRRLGVEISRCVSDADARRFAGRCWLFFAIPFVAIPLALGAVVLLLVVLDHEELVDWRTLAIATPILMLMAFALFTPSVTAYRLHDRRLGVERRLRSVALARYALAPWCLAPVVFVFSAAALATAGITNDWRWLAVAGGLTLIAALGPLWTTMRLSRYALNESPARHWRRNALFAAELVFALLLVPLLAVGCCWLVLAVSTL